MASPSAADARTAFALLNLVGRAVTVTKLDGTTVSGTFCSSSSGGGAQEPSGFSLRYCTLVRNGAAPTPPFGPRDRVKFKWEEVESLLAAKAGGPLAKSSPAASSAPPPASSGRRAVETDTAISSSSSKRGSGGADKRDELKRVGNEWLQVPAPGDVQQQQDKSKGAWDQFATNEQKFGVKLSYNEDMYTSPLNLSSLTPEQIKRAEKMARDIESAAATNSHMAEERGQKALNDGGDSDEEAKYGAVLGTGAFKAPRGAAPPPGLAKPASATSNSSSSWAARVKEGGPPPAVKDAHAAAPGPKTSPAKEAPASSSRKASSSKLPVDEATEKKRRDEEIAAFRKFSEKLGSSPSLKPQVVKSKPSPGSQSREPPPMDDLDLASHPPAAAGGAATASSSSTSASASSSNSPPAPPAAAAAAAAAEDAEKKAAALAASKKLNPNAKTFSFNPNVPAFAPQPPQQQQQQLLLPPAAYPRPRFIPMQQFPGQGPPQPYPIVYPQQSMGYMMPMGYPQPRVAYGYPQMPGQMYVMNGGGVQGPYGIMQPGGGQMMAAVMPQGLPLPMQQQQQQQPPTSHPPMQDTSKLS